MKYNKDISFLCMMFILMGMGCTQPTKFHERTDVLTKWNRIDDVITVSVKQSSGSIVALRAFAGISYSKDGGKTWIWGSGDRPTNCHSTQELQTWGENNFIVATQNGFFRSYDAGQTWTQTSKEWLQSAAIDNSGNIYILSEYGGIRLSSDFGSTWKNIRNDDSSAVYEATIAVDSCGDIFIGSTDVGVLRTTNEGVDWTRSNIGFTKGDSRVKIIQCIGSSVYTAISDLSGAGGLYRSTNCGESWQKISDSVNPGREMIRLSPEMLIFADVGLCYSTNDGITWKKLDAEINQYDNISPLSIVLCPDSTLLLGSDRGMYRSKMPLREFIR